MKGNCFDRLTGSLPNQPQTNNLLSDQNRGWDDEADPGGSNVSGQNTMDRSAKFPLLVIQQLNHCCRREKCQQQQRPLDLAFYLNLPGTTDEFVCERNCLFPHLGEAAHVDQPHPKKTADQ